VKLPTKKIIPLLIACLVAIVSISFAALYPTQARQQVAGNTVAAVSSEQVSVQNTLIERDSDNDGLKDWEESLWDTDTQNADTDGDGTKDGAEVKANRNPAKIGLDSLKSDINIETKATSTPLTVTDKLSRDLFTKYMSLKQSGQEITPEIEQQLVATVLTQETFKTNPEIKYTVESFRIVKDSPESIRAYGNAIGAIIKNYAITQRDSKGRFLHEVLILEQAIDTDNPAELDRITTIITSYQNMLDALLKLNVPQSATNIQLNLANGFNWSIEADKDLQLMYKDSVVALAALSVYQKGSITTAQGFKDLKKYLQESGVVFSENEPGYLVTGGMKF
jgi:hypothetical protein